MLSFNISATKAKRHMLKMRSNINIVVFGLGYVGLSNALILSRRHHVIAVDIDSYKVDCINQLISPIKDEEIKKFLLEETLDLKATLNWQDACPDAEVVVIATPTNYDTDTQSFDVSSVQTVIKQVWSVNKEALIIIKSTVPVGFTESMQLNGEQNICFVPEFLREGHALHDNLFPSRIVVGMKGDKGQRVADLFVECCERKDVPVLLTESSEAEAIKLFANAYLATRVAFFNELDTFAYIKKLDAKTIIEGVGLDPRIGTHYCNPSFGYGGYCLPKDSKQLLTCFQNIPQALIQAVIESNQLRKEFIVKAVTGLGVNRIGIYRLTMKSGSDNFREAAVLDIIESLKKAGLSVIIYEPLLKEKEFNACPVINDLDLFAGQAELILANRKHSELTPYMDKVLTRDIWGQN